MLYQKLPRDRIRPRLTDGAAGSCPPYWRRRRSASHSSCCCSACRGWRGCDPRRGPVGRRRDPPAVAVGWEPSEPLSPALIMRSSAALGLSRDPVALTDGEGSLLIVNPAYRERFGSVAPMELGSSEEAARPGARADDGAARRRRLRRRDRTERWHKPGRSRARGRVGDLLLWRFPSAAGAGCARDRGAPDGRAIGQRLAAAGVACGRRRLARA